MFINPIRCDMIISIRVSSSGVYKLIFYLTIVKKNISSLSLLVDTAVAIQSKAGTKNQQL